MLPPFVTDDLLKQAGSFEAGWHALDVFKALPHRFQSPVKSRYSRVAAAGVEAAKSYISKVETELCSGALSLAASDSEICDFARARADEVRSLLMAQTGAGTAADLRAVLVGYCIEFGAVVPPGVLLAGLCGRMTEAAWWRRQVRRNHARKVEAHAIGLGFVHRRAGLYASDEAVASHADQQRRNAAALKATEATNEEGLTMTLAELSAVSVSNPRLRRGELMTRIAGFEACAKAAGHVGMFYTATAPSRMHARLAKTGQDNPKYDGTAPKECAAYLSKTWAKARAWMHRRGISIYGFRVAEPHHDGTPHWHMLFFMLPAVVESVTACFRRYFCEMDAHELNTPSAEGARFQSVVIDWKRGSAAGYISKYIAKNIDGLRNDLSAAGDDFEAAEPMPADKTAPRVLAWASTWGIRQFQQIGGPGVTVWRELRRLRDAVQGDLFDTWSAADAGNWEAFTERQGGPICRRDARPVQLWKEIEEGKTNRYGEEAGAEIKGVRLGDEITVTRLHTWEIKRGGNGSKQKQGAEKGFDLGGGKEAVSMEAGNGRRSGIQLRPENRPGEVALDFDFGAKRPWSPVNNCTPPTKDADGLKIGALPEPDFPAMKPEIIAEKIKAARVAAVLAGIASKRKRGAFGQFPKLDFSHGPGGQ